MTTFYHPFVLCLHYFVLGFVPLVPPARFSPVKAQGRRGAKQFGCSG
jgi:hypothetical protein